MIVTHRYGNNERKEDFSICSLQNGIDHKTYTD